MNKTTMLPIKTSICTLLVVLLISFSGSATFSKGPEAAVVKVQAIDKYETNSFADVVAVARTLNLQYKPQNVLIVLDIDNTLLTASSDLGGDIWYQWQAGVLEIKPSDKQKVPRLYDQAIGLLYELCPMNLVDESIPPVITSWQLQGNTVMALTSRAPVNRAATERELLRHGIDFDQAALAPKGSKSPLYRETRKRELSYMKGVMMTSGMNKGEMIQYILDKTGRQFKAILFVDDSAKNINAVHDAFDKTGRARMSIIHFTKIEDDRIKKFGAVLTPKQAEQMASDWQKLNVALNEIFPARKLLSDSPDQN